MAIKCSNCGADNRNKAKFCSVCGDRLTQLPAPPKQKPQVWPPPQAPSHPRPQQPPAQRPQAQPSAPQGAPLGFPKVWSSRDQPRIEGKILHIDAPVQEKGSIAGKVMVAGCLALIAPILAFLPFAGGTQVTVRYMRVEDWKTGQQRSVKMRGEPSGIVSVGDWLAVWGKEDGGNIVMNTAYNYTTDAEIRLKT